MDELLNRIIHPKHNEMVALIGNFVQENGNIIDLGNGFSKYYSLEDEFVIDVLYMNMNPRFIVIVVVAIKDRIFKYHSLGTIRFYRLNDSLDKLKNKVLEHPKVLWLDEIDVEEVIGVDVSWVTKRANTKSSRI